MTDIELAKLVVNCALTSYYDVYIGRGRCPNTGSRGHWGNPFSHLEGKGKYQVESKKEAVEQFKSWLLKQPDLIAKVKRELKGKILGCYCRPSAICHGDVLARIANED